MKKNHKYEAWYYHALKKTFLIMRIVLVILLVCIMQSFALKSYTQNSKISLSVKEMKLEDIMMRIEDQTKYRFAYNKNEIDVDKSYSVDINNSEIKELLSKLFANGDVNYTIIDDRQIVLSSKESSNFQQSKSISGKVTDNTGGSLPGVSVVVKGTTNGTITDFDGNYSISNIPANAILQFSFVGMKTKEIPVDGKASINVTLVEETIGIDEVVAIGYGQQSKVKLTGSTVQIKSEELKRVTGTNFAQQISGKMSGVQVNETSGQPGADPKIVIRGIGTLTAGISPLIVADGVPLSEGTTLNSLNPNDIESVNVLKDAASAAIYGSRGANGVIIVTTKKGVSGAPKIVFDFYSGLQRQASKVEFANTEEAALFFTEARDWGYVSKDPTKRSINDDDATRIANGASLRQRRLYYLTNPGLSGLADTKWMNEVFRDAPMSNYSVGISGGNEKSNYSISGNYFDQMGVVIETGYKRYSSSIRLNTELSPKIKFGISINPSYSIQNLYDENGGWGPNPVSAIVVSYPFFSPYNEDGTLAISKQIAANTPQDGALVENPVAIMKTNTNRNKNFRLFGNSFLTFDLAKGLQFKTMLGGDYRSELNEFYSPSYVGKYRTAAPKSPESSESVLFVNNFISENTLNYDKTFGNHQIELLAGYTFQKESGSASKIVGTAIPDDNISNIAGASAYSVTSAKYVWTQVSYLGRAQYFFKERYQLTGTIRRDGSSRFGANSKWGLFPSVAAGWVVSMEPFFPKTDVLSMAKLRASWGQTGNNQIGSYGSIALVNPQNYVYGNTLAAGYATTTSPNPNLSWETRSSTNIGVDLGLFKNKFNLSSNYYSSITSNLLLDVPVPQQSGFSTSTKNIGKVQNSGIEIELGGNEINLGPVKWSFGGNLSMNKNEVLALAPGQTEIITGYQGSYRTKVGGPIAELYGYNILGVYKTQADIDNTPHIAGTLTGDLIVEDINKDGKIDVKDKKGFGSYSPKLIYGFNSNFTFKQFEFSFALNAVQGRKKYDSELASQMEPGEGFGVPSKYYFDHRYHPTDNPDGFLGQPNMGNFTSARAVTRGSSYFFNDASYLRLRQIQIAYNIPKSVLDKVGLTKARIYATGNNLLTITSYRSFNPDSSTDNLLTMGWGIGGSYPTTKSVIFGVNITF